VLQQRKAVERPPQTLHAIFRRNRVVFDQRDEFSNRVFDFGGRCRHGDAR
jgi:hypothetical protein